jgi:DNA-directed RNA polymerase subunit beta
MSQNRSQRALGNLKQRKNFARIPTIIGIPNLIEIQKKSFENFMQWNVDPHERELRGLEDVFNDVYGIVVVGNLRNSEVQV